jgi:hypothetical protein
MYDVRAVRQKRRSNNIQPLVQWVQYSHKFGNLFEYFKVAI